MICRDMNGLKLPASAVIPTPTKETPMNEITGKPFEPLTVEYSGTNNGHSSNDQIYKVTYYDGYNEQRELVTTSRSLAEHLSETKRGSFTTKGQGNG